MDALARHRLALLGLAPSAVEALPLLERVETVYRIFLEKVPFETLSDVERQRKRPAEPETWPRTTDRLLRESAAEGRGGTCFSMAYALADLFRGVGANAHTALGQDLKSRCPHAAVVLYGDEGPRLYEPAHGVPGGLPMWPGGTLYDALFEHALEARCGPMLALVRNRPTTGESETLYSMIPVPAPPDAFRRVWVDAIRRDREGTLRLSRRVGDEFRRYGDDRDHVEILDRDGVRRVDVGRDPPSVLHDLFGIAEPLLRAHFAGVGAAH